MRLMAVMAHPDDAEIWCGGTLIVHVRKGDAVRICSLSYTEYSDRGKEAQQGAKQMGCEVELLGLSDTAIRDTEKSVARLRRSIESFDPDAIITHWFDDMHPDHEAAFRVLRRCLVSVFLTRSKEDLNALPRVYCCDTYHSLGLHGQFNPHRYVDVTQVWDAKVAAINAHESQPISLYLDMIDRQCLAHGKAAGMQLAEGFLYVPAFGRPDDAPLGG